MDSSETKMKMPSLHRGPVTTKTALVVASILSATCAYAQMAKIVGIGASTCGRFNEEIAGTPNAERDYLAWAQGFMSGVLIAGPKGVDEGLDLFPPSLPLRDQAAFLRSFCSSNPNQSFADGVLALYLHLRKIGKNT